MLLAELKISMIKLSLILLGLGHIQAVQELNRTSSPKLTSQEITGYEIPPTANPSSTNLIGVQIKYSVGFLNTESGDFGGNLTFFFSNLKDSATSKINDWGLTFKYPDIFTQVLRFAGPVRFSHYSDGVHLINIRREALAQSALLGTPVFSSFVAKSAVKPTSWNDIQIEDLILRINSTLGLSSIRLTANSDYFLEKEPLNIPTMPFGIFSSANFASGLESDEENSKPILMSLDSRTDINEKDKAELEADGTYLVGFQKSLTIYLIVFITGIIAYTLGTLLRLRKCREFHQEKLRRTSSSGYRQIK